MFFCLVFSWNGSALKKEPIELVAWEKLADFIVEPTGWTKQGELEGIQMDVPTKSEVQQSYVSMTGERSLEIHIFDSDESMIILMPIKMMMHNRDDSEGYAETIEVEGFPGVKLYDYNTKEAGLILLILDRFVLQMFGHQFTKDEVSDLEEIAEKHDLAGISELGKQPLFKL